MALRDIANVTTTLMNLIERSFRVPSVWPGMLPVPTVLAEPPMRTRTNGIGMFLYHITEHPHYKNLPATGYDTPPVRFTSMALTLYYQLSAFQASTSVEGGNDGLMEQQMMSVAMKALHDYPELTDSTIVIGAENPPTVPITDPVFPIDIIGRSNRFKIIYMPVQPTESLSYWTSGDSKLTLSAYYEVSVILLEPEVTRFMSGKVLDYNVFSFVSGNPKILSASNDITFVSPADGRSRTLVMLPAQVAPAAPILPPDVTPHTLTLKGIDIGSGAFVRLTNALWDEPAIPTLAWNQSGTATEINLVVRQTAQPENSGGSVDILPGIYGAQVVRISLKTKGDGTQWPIEATSNIFPFAITPRIDTLGVPALIGATATVTGHLFSRVSGGRQRIELQVYIGPDRLTQVTGAPLAGEFRITAEGSFDYRLPASVTSAQVLPFRIIANGTESAPRWITAP
jgi:Pvc16 N-terminal domain